MKILEGDALACLRKLPDESVNCCVTSPPYWGLRDYGVPKQAWGGNPNHSHEWGGIIADHATNHVDKRRWNHAHNGRGEAQPIAKRPNSKREIIPQGAFCACGAWYGALGLEPTPELFTAHIVEVFREVRRVLRADGTLWLNMGDCYATGGGKVGNCPGGGEQGARWRGDHAYDKKRRSGAIPIGPVTQPNRMALVGLKPKDLVGMPWRVAFALQADGWYLRSDIIWHKKNPMPESVTDRPTKSHEYIFLLSKSAKYYYDAEAIKEPCSADTHARYARGRSDNHKWADGGPGNQTIATNKPGSLFGRKGSGNVKRKLADGTDGRLNTHMGRGIPYNYADHIPGVNPKCAAPGSGVKQNSSFSAAVKDLVPYRNKRTVWTITTRPFKGAHFATFPLKLIEPCILAGCPKGGIVLDPFAGAFTTPMVAQQFGRDFIAIELNPAYIKMGMERLNLRTTAA